MRPFAAMMVSLVCVLLASCGGSNSPKPAGAPNGSPPAATGNKPQNLIVGKWELVQQAGRPVPATRKGKETLEFTADGKMISIMPEGNFENTYKFLDDESMQQSYQGKPGPTSKVSVTRDELSLTRPNDRDMDTVYRRVK